MIRSNQFPICMTAYCSIIRAQSNTPVLSAWIHFMADLQNQNNLSHEQNTLVNWLL